MEGETALYRVHLIINADGFLNPKSYRTEQWAATFEEAWGAAQTSLRMYAKAEGWTGLETISYASCERVPGTERKPDAEEPDHRPEAGPQAPEGDRQAVHRVSRRGEGAPG